MVTLLDDGTEVALPVPEAWSSDSDDEKPGGAVTFLEDGTEVALPVPESWSSDSDDDGPAQEAPADKGGYEPTLKPQPSGASRSKGWDVIHSLPHRNHSNRSLAIPGSEACASLAGLAELRPTAEQSAEELPCTSISADDFANRFVAGPGRVALLKGVAEADQWPAAAKWKDQKTFLKNYGHLPVQVTEMGSLHGLGKPLRVELTFSEYAEYSGSNNVDWPFYVWERNFHGDRAVLLKDFNTPKLLADDIYDLTPQVRDFLPLSCHLFVLMGGRRTGSNMHKDPKWSSAWNTLLCGYKRWVFFPRDVAAEDIGAHTGDAYKEGGPQAYWWLDHYPRLRAEGKRLGMIDVLQGPGDTVFIPAGWWHATLNLPSPDEDVTICCTRNVFPPASLPFVLPRMRAADPAFACFFLGELHKLRPEVLPTWMPEEANKVSADRPVLVGAHESWQLQRRPFQSLSLGEFRRDYVRICRPLIIEGLSPHLVSPETCGLSREWLSTHFGEKRVAAYRNFKARNAEEEDRSDLLKLSEVLSLLRDGGEAADGLYVYDLSLPLQMPGLLDYLRLPRYFAHCYLQQTMQKHVCSKSWPTLFMGVKGTHAKLHVDQWHGHFWMHMVSGRKRWTIFHPEDAHLLAPTVAEGCHHPTFPTLADLQAGKVADAPNFSKARYLDVVLEEGETLFVPGGAPHFVVNLEDSVAFSGNFMDESNFEAAMADIKGMAQAEGGEGAMSGLHAALDEIDFEPDSGLHNDLLPGCHLAVRYNDFAAGKCATWGPVPPNEGDAEF